MYVFDQVAESVLAVAAKTTTTTTTKSCRKKRHCKAYAFSRKHRFAATNVYFEFAVTTLLLLHAKTRDGFARTVKVASRFFALTNIFNRTSRLRVVNVI